MTLEGGCICGKVRYEIDEEAPPVIACFCTDCQTRSGSSHGMTMPVWKSRFAIEGELREGHRTLPTGAAATVYDCAECSTEIYSFNERLEDIVTVRAGTLDNSRELTPAAFMWLNSKPDWIAVPDDARAFETQPDDPAVWMDILEFGRRPQ